MADIDSSHDRRHHSSRCDPASRLRAGRSRASAGSQQARTSAGSRNASRGVVEDPAPRWWWVAFCRHRAASPAIGLFCLGYLISTGVGVWGMNHPVGWAWDITNFVFWIGIGHAGTLISAILFLTRQKWRTSINRAAEAMTLFAVICAGHFPGHPRRPRLDGVVPRAGAERQRHLAELPQPAALGRVRGLDLFHRLGALLVYRPDSRSRDPARPRDDQDQEVPLRHLRARLARRQPPVAPLRDGLPDPGRPLHAAGALGALASCPSTSPRR